MKSLAILGASGHGKVVADAAAQSGWTTVVFFDDAWPAVSRVGTWAVVGTSDDLCRQATKFEGFVVAIGANPVRLLKQRELVRAGLSAATVIHPKASVSPTSELGAGTVVLAGAVINPDARLGVACIVNTCASVDHDCILADGVHVSPGAHLGGNVTVGEATWIGIGAAIRHGAKIGAQAMVAAGATVVADVADGITVAGVPARAILTPRVDH